MIDLYDWRGIEYRGYRIEQGYTPGAIMSPCLYIWECQPPAHTWQPVRICKSVPEAQAWIDGANPFRRPAGPLSGVPEPSQGSRWDVVEFGPLQFTPEPSE